MTTEGRGEERRGGDGSAEKRSGAETRGENRRGNQLSSNFWAGLD